MTVSQGLHSQQFYIDLIVSTTEGMGLNLSKRQAQDLLSFVNLLWKWNKAYNLTAIRDYELIFPTHIWDSLVIYSHLEGKYCLDIGTGAGLPGIPLAIALPDTHFVLLDSNGKKTRFVQQAIIELGLDNVEVVHTRIENYVHDRPFDVLMSRAVATVKDLTSLARHLFGPETCFLFMKSKVVAEEIEELEHLHKDYGKTTIKLDVPDLVAERYLVKITRNRVSGESFQRSN